MVSLLGGWGDGGSPLLPAKNLLIPPLLEKCCRSNDMDFIHLCYYEKVHNKDFSCGNPKA